MNLAASYYTQTLMNKQPRELVRTDVEQAARDLGLTESIDDVQVEAVKEAYRKILMGTHPDQNPGVEPGSVGTIILRARTARQLLEIWIALRPKSDCNVCGGSGRIRNGVFSTRPCPKCG